jgi:hypothetical protein
LSTFQSSRKKTEGQCDFIPPEREGMRGAQARAAMRRDADISDADFEIVRDLRLRPLPVFNDNRVRPLPIPVPAKTSRPAGSRFTGQVVNGAETGLRLLPGKGFAGLAAFVSISIFLAIYFHGYQARSIPLVETPASIRGLAITGVQQSPSDSNGLRVMEISGAVENRSAQALALPALVAELRSDSGSTSKAAISLGEKPLMAGQSARFSVRIPYPGGKHPKVTLTFARKGV